MKIVYKEEEIGGVVLAFLLEATGSGLEKSFLKNISQKFFGSKAKKALVVGFVGDLGAGKTTFTKNLLAGLGVKQNVISPTFVLRRDYKINNVNFSFKNIIHIDAYRLDSHDMVGQILTKEELEDKNNFIIIEWADKLDRKLFDQIYQFTHISESERQIEKML